MNASEMDEFFRETNFMDDLRKPNRENLFREALPCAGCGKHTMFRMGGTPVCCYKCMVIVKTAPIV